MKGLFLIRINASGFRLMNNLTMRLNKLMVSVRNVWVISGIVLLILLIIEIILRGVYSYQSKNRDDYRTHADTYQNAPWVRSYFEEFRQSSRARWEPYLYWRMMPFTGEYINIDSPGIRKTWNAGPEPDTLEERPLIFFFGGSAMWGTGARDNHTIPSLVAKRLHHTGSTCRVINWGESGYVSSQEMMLLIRQLQKGNNPDLVVFYDGANDIFSACQQHRAGLPQNEFHRSLEFNASSSFKPEFFWELLSRRIATIRFLGSISGKPDPADHPTADPSQHLKPLAPSEVNLMRDAVKIYLNNVEIVTSLAKQYNFSVLFYWQPLIFGKKRLTEYETSEKNKKAMLLPYFAVADSILDARSTSKGFPAGFRNLSATFSQTAEPVFIDWCHLGETGNEKIAEIIVKDIMKAMR